MPKEEAMQKIFNQHKLQATQAGRQAWIDCIELAKFKIMAHLIGA